MKSIDELLSERNITFRRAWRHDKNRTTCPWCAPHRSKAGGKRLCLGVRIDEGGAVVVELLPTFLGCPALALMAADVVQAVRGLAVPHCRVVWRSEPSWDSLRISERGVEQLASLGIAVATTALSSPPCPICGAQMLRPISTVGATACRAVAWCGGCRSAIDVMGARRS